MGTSVGVLEDLTIQGREIMENSPQTFSNLWTMFYRHGMNATLSKNFFYKGDLNGAIKKAQEHCKIMGYKYIFLRPLVVDIEKEEDYKIKGGTSEPAP